MQIHQTRYFLVILFLFQRQFIKKTLQLILSFKVGMGRRVVPKVDRAEWEVPEADVGKCQAVNLLVMTGTVDPNKAF